MRVIRDEVPTSAPSRELYAEYMQLVRSRLGDAFVPSEEIFATQDDFAGDGSAWLVVYDGEHAVACGGLRPLGPCVGEIKRMFVTASARGRGHGRALLAALEARARAAGCVRVRLYTTEILREARALYRDAGYRVVGVNALADRRDLWLDKRL